PRFAKSMTLPPPIPDSEVPAMQPTVRGRFTNADTASDSGSDEEDTDVPEGAVEIGDLVTKMNQIGFVAIDQIVVRKLHTKSKVQQYLIIEGNRRVAAAKHLLERKPEVNPD